MRELFRYAMITVGFRFGAYAAGATLILALLLFVFKFNPLGEFRLLLSVVTVVVTVLAMRQYKLIYNGGQLNLTDGLTVSLTVGLINSLFYSLLVLAWTTISPKLWDMHIQDQLRTLEQGKAIIERNYEAGQLDQLKSAIMQQSKSFVALNAFFFRFAWNIIVGFLTSLYFRS
jgi:hypothetical protein